MNRAVVGEQRVKIINLYTIRIHVHTKGVTKFVFQRYYFGRYVSVCVCCVFAHVYVCVRVQVRRI